MPILARAGPAGGLEPYGGRERGGGAGDIRDTSASNVFTLSSQSLFKLLRALNECTEWGQVGACLLSCTIVLTAVHAKPRTGSGCLR